MQLYSVIVNLMLEAFRVRLNGVVKKVVAFRLIEQDFDGAATLKDLLSPPPRPRADEGSVQVEGSKLTQQDIRDLAKDKVRDSVLIKLR